MDMNTIMAMMGRQPQMQQPPGAYGAPQYAPNAGIAGVRPPPPTIQQPGLMEQLGGMLRPDFTPSPERQKAMQAAVAKQIEAARKKRIAQEQAMRQHIEESMKRGPAPQADAPTTMPSADQRLTGLGAARDMQMYQMMKQAGVE